MSFSDEVPERDTDTVRYEEAQRYVQKLKGFYTHLAVCLTVNSFLHLANIVTAGGYWAFWPALAWGIGVAIHGNSVLRWVDYFGREWEERKIREYLGGERREED